MFNAYSDFRGQNSLSVDCLISEKEASSSCDKILTDGVTGRTVCCRSRNQRGPNKTLRSTYRGGNNKKSTHIGCSFSPTRAIFLYDKTRLCRFSVCQRRALCERRCMNHRRVSLWLITSGALKRCYFICEMHPKSRKTSYSLLTSSPPRSHDL